MSAKSNRSTKRDNRSSRVKPQSPGRSSQPSPTSDEGDSAGPNSSGSLHHWLVDYGKGWVTGWNRFWFTPSDPLTLGLIRFLAGSMLVYVLIVWAKDLTGFFGPNGRLPSDFTAAFYGEGNLAWSHLYWFEDSLAALWSVHILAMVIALLFATGFATRYTSILALLITISYANRAAGALFGLDQIVGFLVLYCAIGPSGRAFSIDALLRDRRERKTDIRAGQGAGKVGQLTSATVSIRLIQLHMCVVYLFAGIGKLQGETWWNGDAIWGAIANLEYQSIDLTWLAAHPWLINIATLTTVVWETSYSALVWSPKTRPLVLLLAIPLHMGIALGMGMMTFGLIMLVGNLAFVSPALLRRTGAAIGSTLVSRNSTPAAT